MLYVISEYHIYKTQLQLGNWLNIIFIVQYTEWLFIEMVTRVFKGYKKAFKTV